MTGKPPPTPPQNKSPKGPGENKEVPLKEEPKGGTSADAPDKRGQHGNTTENASRHL